MQINFMKEIKDQCQIYVIKEIKVRLGQGKKGREKKWNYNHGLLLMSRLDQERLSQEDQVRKMKGRLKRDQKEKVN